MIGFTSIQLRAAYAYAQASFRQRTFWDYRAPIDERGVADGIPAAHLRQGSGYCRGRAWTAFATGPVRAQDAALRIIGVIFTVFLLAAINTLVH